MIGMNRTTGTRLSGIDHLRQSITDILTTPIGSRVMRRDYGSRLFELTDSPANPSHVIEVFAAIAEALDNWEPRFKLSRVISHGVTIDGKLSVSVVGEYLQNGKQITMDGIIL